MNWRSLRVVRAWAAAGLLISVNSLVPASRAQVAEPAEPVPGPDAQAQTVDLLDARESGLLAVAVRGQGDDKVSLELRNNGPRRLSVVIPPGLVASAAAGQFQSMGLGQPTNRPGGFGQFSSSNDNGGFRSMPVDSVPSNAVTVPAGDTLRLTMPAVCLNFGLPDPTPRDSFDLMDVTEYTPDQRAQRTLRSLGSLGTSRGVAQAAAWNVFNGMSLGQIAARAPRQVNTSEAALAGRFVQAIDASSSEVLESAYLTEGRVFVRVQADDDLRADADRLAAHLDGLHVLGLPARVSTGDEPETTGPALYLIVTLTSSNSTTTAGRVAVKGMSPSGQWVSGGTAKLSSAAPVSALDSPALAQAIERAVAREFIDVRPVKRVDGGTVVRVSNRLPFTLSTLVLDAAGDPTSPVSFDSVGLGPQRSTEVKIQSTGATLDRVELNGL